MEGGRVVCSGRIREIDAQGEDNETKCCDNDGELDLSTKDAYKELRIRGYEYGPHFQCIQKLSTSGKKACTKVASL